MACKLSRLQWLNRHKQRGSANGRKARLKITRLHQRSANIRKDTLPKLTSHLAKNHGMVLIEDLNLSGVMANRRLSKAVQDMGFYGFRWQLDDQAKLCGSSLRVVDRRFPSSKTCSHCGTKKDTLLLLEWGTERSHCGFKIDRDLNAAMT